MHHHKKRTYKKKRGGELSDYVPDSVKKFFGTKPSPASTVLEKPTEVATKAVEKTSEIVGVPATSEPGGVPGSQTSPEEAKMLGGRRKRTRKTRRRKSRY